MSRTEPAATLERTPHPWLALIALLATLLALSLPAPAAQGSAIQRFLSEEPDFLPVDEAFRLTTELGADNAVLVRWEMPAGYYLYRHRFDFMTRPVEGERTTDVVLGEPEIPPGKHKVDEYFGEVEVYYDQAQARVPIKSGVGPVEVGISYQGCADAGLC